MYEAKQKIIKNFIYKYLAELKSKHQTVPYTIRHSYQISNSNRNNMPYAICTAHSCKENTSLVEKNFVSQSTYANDKYLF